MKKVARPNQIKLVNGNNSIRLVKSIIDIYRPKNKMINEEALKGKVSGSSFKDYTLDLMKLK